MSFSHFNYFECIQSVYQSMIRISFLLLQRFAIFLVLDFGIHCVCVCVCALGTLAFFSGRLSFVAISKITLLNYCKRSSKQYTHDSTHIAVLQQFYIEFGMLVCMFVCWVFLLTVFKELCQHASISMQKSTCIDYIPFHICMYARFHVFSFDGFIYFPFQTNTILANHNKIINT